MAIAGQQKKLAVELTVKIEAGLRRSRSLFRLLPVAAAQAIDPTAIQNRQDQKEAFLAKGGDAATRNAGSRRCGLALEPYPAGAALSTLFGLSSELAVSNQGNVNGNTVIALRDSAQVTANQVGQEITRRNLSIQPTLTVRPGFRVNVMVNKDLVLRPYQPLFIQRGPMP